MKKTIIISITAIICTLIVCCTYIHCSNIGRYYLNTNNTHIMFDTKTATMYYRDESPYWNIGTQIKD